MHFRTAREAWTPTDLHRAKDGAPTPLNGERDYLSRKIREHEQEIARHADLIRLLRIELDRLTAGPELVVPSSCAGLDR